MIFRFAGSLALLLSFTLSGCASYYTHYAVFPAENSAGEERQFKLTWQTADYPDWWFADDQSTPITLESQCSERRWRLVDSTHSDADREGCAGGIRACGSSGLDQRAKIGPGAGLNKACMQINPQDPGAKVTDIGSVLELQVSCEPKATVQQTGGEEQNIDYLRASPVPYKVYSRKGLRGRLDSRPPELNDSPCDEK